ncbi:MAG: NAD-dependent epimerase/dehydratase family protein, partial [Halobacteriaceae archaeon]
MGVHLVTGGSGFVGSHIAEYLVEQGETVHIFDQVPPDVPGTSLRSNCKFIQGDIRDSKLVSEAVSAADYVYHNIALVPISRAGNEFWEVNVEGTRTLMQAALDTNLKGLVHMSSSAVYDLSTTMPITEDTEKDPIGQYGQSKLDADDVVLEYADKGVP